MKASENDFGFVKAYKIFEIPFFQRKYVWNENNWEELLQDLMASFRDNREHFLGSIILKNKENKVVSLIDGQQRLTTFSILIKALYDLNKADEFRDYIFTTKGQDNKKHPKIKHSYLDKKAFDSLFDEGDNGAGEIKNNIVEAYKYFYENLKNHDKGFLYKFAEYITESKLWVVITLDLNEDEQKIFDSINTTGVKLNASDIIKNALFGKALKLLNDDEAQVLEIYKEYWGDIFEKDEETKEFWDTQKAIGRIKRTQSEILFHSIAIISGFYDPEKDTLDQLSKLYKNKLDDVRSIGELKKFLWLIGEYANLYKKLPFINDGDTFEYENANEKRCFHIMDIYDSYSVLALILKMKKELDEKERDKSIYLIEMLLLCNLYTKDYNRFFAQLCNGKLSYQIIKNKILSHNEYKKYLTIASIEERLKSIRDNKKARLILFWIELFKEYQNRDTRDKVGLNYVYTLEHLMPQSWKTNWSHMVKECETEEEKNKKAESLIYQIGNMTLLKGKLNSILQNESWDKKINGVGDKKKSIRQNADLLITKEILDIKEWSEQEIARRTDGLIKDFLRIWDVSVFEK